ncbi:hypothetical protein [Thiovibrio frasassiensis]|uniref:Uncharacterized protein n=1 Tax=Thiovibrio frasassiensis TaxID=2984131 RepID=A0A9X4MGI2_9BACT|nr:hypothetical protein [Thiovibrio frasassiensis]MDG4476202.1 hypothetical protein [Thiovibrio frasassiensis]
MSRLSFADLSLSLAGVGQDQRPTERECIALLALDAHRPESLPFYGSDATTGCENELQVAVTGRREDVDLPRAIEQSSYYANIIKRADRGETSPRARRNLERYLDDNLGQVWENSWVRFPLASLHPHAMNILAADLKADKQNPGGGERSDAARFFVEEGGERLLHIPISYLLKLALADLLGEAGSHETVRKTGSRMLTHLLSDNTSPETFSFHVTAMHAHTGYGNALARETAKRFLFTQLLIMYANEKFELLRRGQKATLFFSPHPPVRQRALNECISDAFYRKLFMSPCLSGWDEGEAKHQYMILCHQVLSRSHLNAVMKMREAGIITTNLVMMPQTSNISLANNGTHVSMGSLKLSRLLRDPGSGFTVRHEKYLGDLVAKIMEHFLPLFVSTYSAAPYRLGFEDFHPEQALGFLPHQLDYTHLRMLWRRWRKKARNKFCGQALTPFGPQRLDQIIGGACRCKGDFVPDFRLIDYPVALLSTEQSGSQDGRLHNDRRLKEDLDMLGIFDKRMSVYLPYKLREFEVMGFSGFEARQYSLFEQFDGDLGRATDLQMLLNALAFKLIANGTCSHQHIPDTPFVESERRQILFGTAIGIPTFFVRKETPNRFLRNILKRTKNTRSSRRYSGYQRVLHQDYRLALLQFIRNEGAELVEGFGFSELLADLELRLREPDRHGALGRLTKGILASEGADSPFEMPARDFNLAAERYYREELRQEQIKEGWQHVVEDIKTMGAGEVPLALEVRGEVQCILGSQDVEPFLRRTQEELLSDSLSQTTATQLLQLMIIAEDLDSKRQKLTL